MFVKKPIKEIANFIKTGKTPPSKERKYFGGEINWYTPGDLSHSKYLKKSLRSITQIAIDENKAIKFPKNTLLIGCIGDIGKLGITISECSSNQQITGILPKDFVNVNYLYYWFYSHKNILENTANNAVVPILNNRSLEKIQIPLPPLETQKKIANILDAADTLRQKTKTLIEKYDQLTQSLFLYMAGALEGKKESLADLCEINPKKSEVAGLNKNMEVSFVPMSNVSETGIVKLDEVKKLDEVWNGFTYFKDNDVVFAKITPCMENGKGAIMRNLVNGIGFGTTEFHVLRPFQNISTSEWLYHLTSNKEFRKQAEANMTGSAGQKRVPKDFFKKFKVICPPLPLQNQFAERVQAIEDQKTKAQASLEKSEELFQSLLQRAFNGEIN